MNECWRQHGVNRPSAKAVFKNLESLLDSIDGEGEEKSAEEFSV